MAVDVDDHRESSRTLVSVLIAVAWLCWLAAIPVYGASVLATWTFFGESATPEDEQRQLVLALVALGLSLGPSILALVVTIGTRRRVAASLLAVAVVLALVPLALVGAAHARSSAQHPEPADRPSCVAFSGGRNTCPGG